MKNVVGVAMWDVWLEVAWCAKSGKITRAANYRSWSTIAMVGWRDAGQTAYGSRIVNNTARSFAQRKMALGVGGWDVQKIRQCVRISGTVSGSSKVEATCSYN